MPLVLMLRPPGRILSLLYEPAAEPLHISVNLLFILAGSAPSNAEPAALHVLPPGVSQRRCAPRPLGSNPTNEPEFSLRKPSFLLFRSLCSSLYLSLSLTHTHAMNGDCLHRPEELSSAKPCSDFAGGITPRTESAECLSTALRPATSRFQPRERARDTAMEEERENNREGEGERGRREREREREREGQREGQREGERGRERGRGRGMETGPGVSKRRCAPRPLGFNPQP